MRRSRKPLIIASRPSPLAKIQAQLVGKVLARLHPQIAIEYRWIESEGDRFSQRPLAGVGGKGLFTAALEQALLKGDADIAVHSLKDMPADETPGLVLAAIPKRSDVRDCLIARDGVTSIDELPQGATVGTSSPRRAAQALAIRPDLQIVPMRGNVDTRLEKIQAPVVMGSCDATFIAAAALRRLGRADLTEHAIATDVMLPAACQGALAVQCRSDDHVTLTRCLPLNDPTASTSAHAERQVVAGLGADCHSPVAVLAEPVDPSQVNAKRNADAHWFTLQVKVLSVDGTTCLSHAEKVKTKDLRHLVKRTVELLHDQGARVVLAEASDSFGRGVERPLPGPTEMQQQASKVG